MILLRNLPAYKLITVFVTIKLLFSLILYLIATIFHFTNELEGYKSNSMVEELCVAVVIAPIIETLFIQYLIIKGILILKGSRKLAMLVSAGVFACLHNYSFVYMLAAFIMGYLLAFLYVYSEVKKEGFQNVLMAHSIYNLIAVIINQTIP